METAYTLSGGPTVHRIGFGAMRLCGQPGNFGRYPQWEEGKRLLRDLVTLGVQIIDTAEPYGPGFNEELIAEALYPYPADLVIATKGGVVKDAPDKIYPDGRPERLRQAAEASLKRLRLETIPLYYFHRPDPKVPFADSIGALVELKAEGKVQQLGLSNVTLKQLQEAQKQTPIVAVQNRYAPHDREFEELLAYCDVQNIAFFPYGSLGAHPQRYGAPLAQCSGVIETMAKQHDATPIQLALAWLLHHRKNIVLIPGSTRLAHMRENLAATQISLSADEMQRLARAYSLLNQSY
ncbi:MAG: aldo/keto reductase [Planctomycetaceae bacterium]